jgi:integrase
VRYTRNATNTAGTLTGARRGDAQRLPGHVPVDPHQCRPDDRALKAVTKKAGIGENWTPRELRHSFVSIMSDNGVPIETIADLVGHASTAVTEEVYRHQLNPVITKSAETMNTIFNQRSQAKSA